MNEREEKICGQNNRNCFSFVDFRPNEFAISKGWMREEEESWAADTGGSGRGAGERRGI